MNIVSIDFDIIMAPSINFYNSLHDNKEKIYPELIAGCKADLSIYNKISSWLYYMAKQLPVENIIFIESHERIIKHIPEDGNTFLFNIDHHHDLGYDDKNKDIEDENEVNCGNWGRYLLNKNLLQAFIWIGNKEINKSGTNITAYNYINSFNLNNLYADKIIICLSPEWVPEHYHPLFFNWINTLRIMKNTNFILN